jgi:hypothetical protein
MCVCVCVCVSVCLCVSVCVFVCDSCLSNFLLFTSYEEGQVALPAFYVKLTENVKSNNVAAITQYMVKTVIPSSQKSSALPFRVASLSLTFGIHLIVLAVVAMFLPL